MYRLLFLLRKYDSFGEASDETCVAVLERIETVAVVSMPGHTFHGFCSKWKALGSAEAFANWLSTVFVFYGVSRLGEPASAAIAGRIIPEIITFTLRDAESCD